MDLFIVNTEETQTWMHRVLNGDLKETDDGWWSLPNHLSLRPDVLEQLVNDTKIVERTPKGRVSVRWEKVDDHKPNDYRAAARYTRAAAHQLSQHGLLWHKLPDRAALYGTPKGSEPPRKAPHQTAHRKGSHVRNPSGENSADAPPPADKPRPGQTCPACGVGRLRVSSCRVEGDNRIRYLKCPRCRHNAGKQVVPLEFAPKRQ